MIKELVFDEKLYDYLKSTNSTQIARSKIFDLDSKQSQDEYKRLLSMFKKWIFYYRSHSFDNKSVNQIFFDFERMITEYSLHYGIKSGEEMVSEISAKPQKNSTKKSIEDLIKTSMEQLEEYMNHTDDKDYKDMVRNINEWDKSFIINCIPNVLNGNYVNVPVEFVVLNDVNDSIPSFDSDRSYYFDFFNILPLKVNLIKIANKEFFNIINVSIVPMFLTLSKKYIIKIDDGTQ
jgi:hypothetical protein